jgi:hypothetical protein
MELNKTVGKSSLLALILHIHAPRRIQCPERAKHLTEPAGTQPTAMFPTPKNKNTRRSQEISAVPIEAVKFSDKIRTYISLTRQNIYNMQLCRQ